MLHAVIYIHPTVTEGERVKDVENVSIASTLVPQQEATRSILVIFVSSCVVNQLPSFTSIHTIGYSPYRLAQARFASPALRCGEKVLPAWRF